MNRKKLLDYINDQALNTPDIPDAVPHVPGTVRGKKVSRDIPMCRFPSAFLIRMILWYVSLMWFLTMHFLILVDSSTKTSRSQRKSKRIIRRRNRA